MSIGNVAIWEFPTQNCVKLNKSHDFLYDFIDN